MKTNFHTHTTRCLHAVGTDEQYVKAALKGGFDVLGFADHAPWFFPSGHVSHCRMPAARWPEYKQSVLHLKEKYAGQIDIRLGAECEYYPAYIDQLKMLRDNGFEYFILACHFLDTEETNPYTGISCSDDDELRRYADAVVKGIETGLYCYIAHPDLFMMARRSFDRVCEEATDLICQAAKEHHMPLEYNLLGLNDALMGHSRGYPHQDFWQHVSSKWVNDVILGVDAHDPAALSNVKLWDTAMHNVREMGLTIVTDWK